MAGASIDEIDLRILLVEDDPDDARRISRLLKRIRPARAEVVPVGCLADAMPELVQGPVVDVVLLDLDLPDSSGLETLRRLRAVAPSIPVIVLSDRDEPELGLRSVAEGAQDCVVKRDLRAAVVQAALRHAMERQRRVNEMQTHVGRLDQGHLNFLRMVNAGVDARLVIDREGRVMFANPAAERLCPKPRAGLVGSMFDLPMAGGEARDFDNMVYLADRGVMAEMRVADFEWRGQPAFLIQLHDITQRVRTLRDLADANRALRDSEARFLAFGDASPAAFTIKDLEGRYLSVNREFARRRGIPMEEIIGRTADDIFPAERAVTIRALDREVLASDTTLSYEMDAPVPGSRFVEWAVKFPIKNADGTIVALGSISTEITKRKVAEEALQRSVRALRTLSACNEALVRARSEEDLLAEICRLIVEVGGYAFAWVGYAEAGADKAIRPVARYGEAGIDVDPAVPLGAVGGDKGCPTSQALRTGVPVVVTVRSGLSHCSFYQTFFVGLHMRSAVALPLGNGKGPIGALTIFSREDRRFDEDEIKLLVELVNDLAFGIQSLRADGRRRKAEEALRTLQRAVEQSPSVVMITNADGVIEYVNPAFTEATGYTAVEAIGQRPSLIRSGEVREHVYANLWSTIRDGQTWRGTLHNRRKDGSPYWVEAVISPVRAEYGSITHFIGIQEDITERLETEKRLRQSEKMESLGNLAGGIAHDFNNMLLPILTLSTMAMRDLPEGDRQRRRLEMVVEAAERARALVQRILAFSRTGDSTRENTDMAVIVEDAVALLRVTLPKTIDLVTRIDPKTGEADIDRAQVQTMLLNLASNAADAMGGKTGRLEIELTPVDLDEAARATQPGLAKGTYAKLVVRDTGSGIPEEILPHIFEPFFTTKKVGEGTGLGLAMVHGIVTDHKGAISVESTVGVGTAFQILLPLRSRTERTAATTAA